MVRLAAKKSLSIGRVVLVLLLFLGAWYLMQVTSGVVPVPIKQSLGGFPHTVGDSHLTKSFQSSGEVLELLGVDDYLQYNYIDGDGQRVNFYVGYYKAVGVTGSYHSPKNCLPGGGWGIDSIREVQLNVPGFGDKPPVVSEMLIRQGDMYQVVLYWYQNRGRIIASEYSEKIYQVLDALLMGRRDGAFVRVMTVAADGDLEAARQRAQRFGAEAMTELKAFLPGESL